MKKKHSPEDYAEPLIHKELIPIEPQPIMRNTPLIEDQLQATVEQDSSIRTVSKELFNEQAIDLKTEVTHDEINDITRIRFLHEKFGLDNIDPLLKSFLRLRVSKDRKSREEFVQIVQTENRNNQSGGLMARLMGRNNQGGTQ